MVVKVQPRSKSIKAGEYPATSLEELVAQISRDNKLNANRLRITSTNGKVVSSDAELENEVYVKDLGPQIGWRTVYILEYLGPILVHYLAFQLAGEPVKYKLLYQLNLIHYFKREVENVFVHKFSSSTMPLFNLFKNSAHYWILGGLVSSAYFNFGNLPIDFGFNPDYLFYPWCTFEFFNAVTHIQLRLLWDKTIGKGKAREIPKGGFFELFIAPNYTMEIYGWLTILLLQPNIFTLVFWLTGTVQMYFWSIKKQQKYGTKRYFLIPFIF